MKGVALRVPEFGPDSFELESFLQEMGRGQVRRSDERAIELCDNLVEIISALFNVPGKELRSRGRSSHSIAHVRQIAMYLAHVVLRLSMKQVGTGFFRDRTTVLQACHRVEDMRDDLEFDRMVARAERVVAAALASKLEV